MANGGRADESWWRQQHARRIRDSSYDTTRYGRASSNIGDSLRRGELRYDPVRIYDDNYEKRYFTEW